MLELVLGGLFTLVLGSYAFTGVLWKWVYTLYNNHLKHLDERVKSLEDDRDRTP